MNRIAVHRFYKVVWQHLLSLVEYLTTFLATFVACVSEKNSKNQSQFLHIYDKLFETRCIVIRRWFERKHSPVSDDAAGCSNVPTEAPPRPHESRSEPLCSQSPG